jgi:diguanylate cyclase (GGDEF)-like protein
MILEVARKPWPWLGGATLLMILLSALTLVLFRQNDEAEHWRSHTYVVLNQAERMLSAMKDAETGGRGYLLTGDETFLEPYLAVRDTVGGQVEQLRQLTRDNPGQQQRLTLLSSLAKSLLAHWLALVDMRLQGDITEAKQAVRGGENKRLMDDFRAEMARFIQTENELLALRDASFTSSRALLIETMVAVISFAALLVAVSAYTVQRETRRRLIEQEQISAQLAKKNEEMEVMAAELRQMAFHDALTKLPNRRLLGDHLSQTMAASKRSGLHAALLLLDLDNFKTLNDTYGHDAGDLLLIEVADRLKCCVRAIDTVARFGGDEFAVLIGDLAADKVESMSQAKIVAEKIRIILSNPYLVPLEHEGQAQRTVEHHCTASIGVVIFINHQASQEDILKWADAAMYRAKDQGRNTIVFHGAEGQL